MTDQILVENPTTQPVKRPVDIVLKEAVDSKKVSFGEPVVVMVDGWGGQKTSDAYYQTEDMFCLYDGPGFGEDSVTGAESLLVAKGIVDKANTGENSVGGNSCVLGHLTNESLNLICTDGLVEGVFLDEAGHAVCTLLYVNLEFDTNIAPDVNRLVASSGANGLETTHLNDIHSTTVEGTRVLNIPLVDSENRKLIYLKVATDGFTQSFLNRYDFGRYSPDPVGFIINRIVDIDTEMFSDFASRGADRIGKPLKAVSGYQEKSLSTGGENSESVIDDITVVYIPIKQPTQS